MRTARQASHNNAEGYAASQADQGRFHVDLEPLHGVKRMRALVAVRREGDVVCARGQGLVLCICAYVYDELWAKSRAWPGKWKS